MLTQTALVMVWVQVAWLQQAQVEKLRREEVKVLVQNRTEVLRIMGFALIVMVKGIDHNRINMLQHLLSLRIIIVQVINVLCVVNIQTTIIIGVQLVRDIKILINI